MVATTMEHIPHYHIDRSSLLQTVSIHIVNKAVFASLKAYTNRGYLRNIRLLRRLIYFCSNFHASYCLFIFSNISPIFTPKQSTPLQTSSRRTQSYFAASELVGVFKVNWACRPSKLYLYTVYTFVVRKPALSAAQSFKKYLYRSQWESHKAVLAFVHSRLKSTSYITGFREMSPSKFWIISSHVIWRVFYHP